MEVSRRRERRGLILVNLHGTPKLTMTSETYHSVQQRKANKMTINVSIATFSLYFVMEK